MTKWRLSVVIAVFFILPGCQSDNTNTNPDVPVEVPNYTQCVIPGNASSFELMTWNLEEFPIRSESTIERAKKVIMQQQPDVIAVQEITSVSSFNELLEGLDNYESQIHNFGSLKLAFMYKSSEVSVIENLEVILDDDPYAFPRAPIMISFEHISGIESVLINIHLKCCGGSENIDRRSQASIKLKEYIDSNLADDMVILLGDYNGLITGVPENENSFINFINDSINYSFTDMDIASGEEAFWSYPDWPSHIDHILITNELFDLVAATNTLILDDCDDDYLHMLSDHRPVMIKLEQ